MGEEGALQVYAAEHSAGFVRRPVGRSHLTDAHKLVLQQGHARRTNLGHPPAELVPGHDLQALRASVGEVLPTAAVEVHVGEAGNHIAPGCVIGPAAGAAAGEQPSVKAHIPLDKALFDVKNLTAGYPHTVSPASTSLCRAALSPTRVTSGWSWRMEAGMLLVTRPQKA